MGWLSVFVGLGCLSASELPVSEPPGVRSRMDRIFLHWKSSHGKPTILYTTNGAPPRRDDPATLVWSKDLMVQQSTVLRAAMDWGGERTIDVGAFTYLFPGDVVRQTGVGHSKTWGRTNGVDVLADYEMDPEIVTPGSRAAVEQALREIPTLCLTMDPRDWFDSKDGIYANPRETGAAWERRVQVEYFPNDTATGFRLVAGVRIQGGWNRRPEESPKHALRLIFRRRYGEGSLRYNLFDGGLDQFETLILRAGCNNTWLHWNGAERVRGDYLRDQWMRETYASMGQLSARGRFVHLYLNGLYWGLYNLVERPSAPFVAAHLGGKPGDYDSRNGENILEGDDLPWKRLFELANAGVTQQAEFESIASLLDVDAFIDFMLLNLYGANGDWDRVSNWYAARNRKKSGKFIFMVWDGERTLESVEGNVLASDDDQSPLRLFQKLRASPEFRRRFGRRARTHLNALGALSPSAAWSRYERWVMTLDGPMLAESARWGDYRRDVHPYKNGPYELYRRDEHWRREVHRLRTEYFPKRTEKLVQQLAEAGLY